MAVTKPVGSIVSHKVGSGLPCPLYSCLLELVWPWSSAPHSNPKRDEEPAAIALSRSSVSWHKHCALFMTVLNCEANENQNMAIKQGLFLLWKFNKHTLEDRALPNILVPLKPKRSGTCFQGAATFIPTTTCSTWSCWCPNNPMFLDQIQPQLLSHQLVLRQERLLKPTRLCNRKCII